MRRRGDGRFVISEKWDTRIDRAVLAFLIFVFGWIGGIVQASTWHR